MKNFLIILCFISLPLFAQVNKGKIYLVCNEEKFDLPITQIVLRKENNLLISMRAEKSDSSSMQSISLEFSLPGLAKNEKISSDVEPRLSIISQTSKNHYGKRFNFNYGPKDAVIEMYYGDEKMNWSSPSFQFKFDKVEVTHSNEGLKIVGSFSGKFISTSRGIQPKTTVEIKDGKFEIIL